MGKVIQRAAPSTSVIILIPALDFRREVIMCNNNNLCKRTAFASVLPRHPIGAIGALLWCLWVRAIFVYIFQRKVLEGKQLPLGHLACKEGLEREFWSFPLFLRPERRTTRNASADRREDERPLAASRLRCRLLVCVPRTHLPPSRSRKRGAPFHSFLTFPLG